MTGAAATQSAPFDAPETLLAHDVPGSLWNRLAGASGRPDPFCSLTAWQLSFRDAVDPDRPVLVRQSGDGLVHMVLHRLGGAFCLGPMERSWLFGCNVLGPEGPDVLAEMLAEPGLRALGLDQRLVVSGLSPSGTLLPRLKQMFGEMRAIRRDAQCAASLAGGLDGYLSRRSGNFRKNLKRVLRGAADRGVVLERAQPQSAREADIVFMRILDIENRCWKARVGEEAVFWIDFYAGLLRRLSVSGDGRVIFAVRNGVDVGYIFGGMVGGIYRGQQFSFDEEHRDLSVGNLLQHGQISWLCEEGAERYDMGPAIGPYMEYKVSWTEQVFPIEAWYFGQRT